MAHAHTPFVRAGFKRVPRWRSRVLFASARALVHLPLRFLLYHEHDVDARRDVQLRRVDHRLSLRRRRRVCSHVAHAQGVGARNVSVAVRRRRCAPLAAWKRSSGAARTRLQAWKHACRTAGRSSTCSRASWLWDGRSWRRARCVFATTTRRRNQAHERNEWKGMAATAVHVAWTCDERRFAEPKRSTRLTRTWTTTMRREAPRHVAFVRRKIPHARPSLANATGTSKTSDETAPIVPNVNARIQTDHG